MSDIKDLIQHALDQDYNKASEVFGNAMSVKIQDVLDQEKVKLANQIYNGVEAEEDDELDAADLADMSDEELDAAFDEAGEELGDDDESEEDEVSEEDEDEASDDDEEQ
jgi:hypothetical protein